MLRSVLRTSTRAFHVRAALLNALVFKMPAMSPTMTEGGIVAWKYKAGDEFALGDVLLEVETDKATIDVEALDDGVMWEILVQDGASGIPVGQPIALLAEPGDDLATLERPALDDTSASAKPEETKPEPKTEPKEEPKLEPKKAAKPADSTRELVGKANRAVKLTPAVEVLLHRHGISADDAYSKIPASGPKGRILKGDVLAYLGEIDASAVTKVAEYISHKEHLDLSNIKIAAPKPAEPAAEKPAEKAEKPRPTNILTIEFTSDLGEGVSKEKFQYAFEKALEGATRQTYGARFPAYATSPSASPYVADDIFDDLLVAPVTKNRFEVYGVEYRFVGSAPAFAAPVDAFDELLGAAPAAPSTFEAEGSVSAQVSFKVKYDAKLADSKEFVEYFQDALLSQIPTKQLIIHS